MSGDDVVPYSLCRERLDVGDFLKPLDLFREKEVVRMCAPMVRYSK